jgi:hypothetical protein
MTSVAVRLHRTGSLARTEDLKITKSSPHGRIISWTVKASSVQRDFRIRVAASAPRGVLWSSPSRTHHIRFVEISSEDQTESACSRRRAASSTSSGAWALVGTV